MAYCKTEHIEHLYDVPREWVLKKKKLWQIQKYSEKNQRLDRLGNVIKFNLSFETWLEIWMTSGKLELRGTKAGMYCMSRYNDIGDYEVGNVFIQLTAQNTSQAQLGKTVSEESRLKLCASLVGRQGHPSPFKGKTWSEARRKAQRERKPKE